VAPAAAAGVSNQKADELERLLQRINRSSDPEEKISLVKQALQVEPQIRIWDFASWTPKTQTLGSPRNRVNFIKAKVGLLELAKQLGSVGSGFPGPPAAS
jgi:hypothetical protein